MAIAPHSSRCHILLVHRQFESPAEFATVLLGSGCSVVEEQDIAVGLKLRRVLVVKVVGRDHSEITVDPEPPDDVARCPVHFDELVHVAARDNESAISWVGFDGVCVAVVDSVRFRIVMVE